MRPSYSAIRRPSRTRMSNVLPAARATGLVGTTSTRVVVQQRPQMLWPAAELGTILDLHGEPDRRGNRTRRKDETPVGSRRPAGILHTVAGRCPRGCYFNSLMKTFLKYSLLPWSCNSIW